MKKFIFLFLFLVPIFTIGQTYTSQQGNKYFKGFIKFAKRIIAEDTVRVSAKGIKYADGSIGTTGFQSGDTISLDSALHFNTATDTLATKAQLRALNPTNSVSRDSLYIGADGYVHYLKDGYDVRLAVKDSTSLTSQLLTDLTAYWSLEETTGSAVDSSGNNWTGTLSGTISQGTGGKLGKCYNFEADSAGYINFGNTLGSSFLLDDISVSCWINVESQPGNHGIIGTANGENSWYLYNSSGTIIGNISDGQTLTSTQSNSAVSTGVWHHIVYIVDRDGYAKLYIDGALQTDQDNISAFAASNLSTTNQLNVGTWGDGYWQVCFDGKIDEVGIWSRVLTADEVSDLYNSGSGLAYPF